MVFHVADEDGINELPEDYEPSRADAIVGWARQNYHHLGNQKLRDVVYEYVPQYVHARSKAEKGDVISAIIERIRRESPTNTGFVRQNPHTLRWSYIGLEKAKDKIGHALRKAVRDYRRKRSLAVIHSCQLYSSYQLPIPHSNSSSSLGALDSMTTTTRSLSSCDSEDDDDVVRNLCHDYPLEANEYAAHHHCSELTYFSQPAYHSAQYPYPDPGMVYTHHHLSTRQFQPTSGLTHHQDSTAMGHYYHHHNYYSYPNGVHYLQEASAQPYQPLVNYSMGQGTVNKKTPKEEGTAFPRESGGSPIPILPKSHAYYFTTNQPR